MSKLLKDSQAFIVLKTKDIINKDLIGNASIGGFSVRTKNGQLIPFDWDTCVGNKKQCLDGKTLIEWKLFKFDIDDYIDLWKKENTLEYISLEKITNNPIEEIAYEAYTKDDIYEQNCLEMDLVDFSIEDCISSKTIIKSFSNDIINKYNKSDHNDN